MMSNKYESQLGPPIVSLGYFHWNRKKSIAWNEKIEYIGFTHFLQVHKWVNYESMLEKCFVGKLKSTPPAHRRGKHEKNRSPWPDFVVLIPIWKQYEVSNAFKTIPCVTIWQCSYKWSVDVLAVMKLTISYSLITDHWLPMWPVINPWGDLSTTKQGKWNPVIEYLTAIIQFIDPLEQ